MLMLTMLEVLQNVPEVGLSWRGALCGLVPTPLQLIFVM